MNCCRITGSRADRTATQAAVPLQPSSRCQDVFAACLLTSVGPPRSVGCDAANPSTTSEAMGAGVMLALFFTAQKNGEPNVELRASRRLSRDMESGRSRTSLASKSCLKGKRYTAVVGAAPASRKRLGACQNTVPKAALGFYGNRYAFILCRALAARP